MLNGYKPFKVDPSTSGGYEDVAKCNFHPFSEDVSIEGLAIFGKLVNRKIISSWIRHTIPRRRGIEENFFNNVFESFTNISILSLVFLNFVGRKSSLRPTMELLK